MDKLFSMRVFSRVAETGSFSGVAKSMDCSVGIVSRAVVSLEDSLRTRLLQRTTRRVSLTDSGERYYQKCKEILAQIDSAEAEASDAATVPRGRLRVHASPDLGLAQLMSAVVEYRRAHPQVSVDLKLLPGIPDLVHQQFDVSVLAAAALPDSGNAYRIVGRFERVLVAAPGYLRRHAVESLGDLSTHARTRISAPFGHPCDWHSEFATDSGSRAEQLPVRARQHATTPEREPNAAKLAAKRATPEDRIALRRAFKAMERAVAGQGEYVPADLAFHGAILTACHNQFVQQMQNALSAILRTSFELSSEIEGGPARSLPMHEALCIAIEQGDAHAAEQAVLTLIERAEKDFDDRAALARTVNDTPS